VDLLVLQEMANEFTDYILRGGVYRTVLIQTERGQERVQSSGGDVLARLHRLVGQRADLPPDQQGKLDALQAALEQEMKAMGSRFRDLLVREAKARLNSLRWFMDECAEDRRQCRVQYPFEIRNRQRLSEIMKALGAPPPPDLVQELAAVDRRLRGIATVPGFVWEANLAPLFPREEYWFLYVSPVGKKED
jgi:hypothetical protein